MATNKFATILHRNTNRFTVILVYTLLEWILILLLLLNSLFSYLISKFASFFGLQPPCLWCSRLDRLIEPQMEGDFYRNLICEAHASEISKLQYCSNHRRLAEACGMCEECSTSRPSQSRVERHITFISLVPSDGSSKIQTGADEMKCSCCGVTMDEGLYSPYLLFKPSWDVLDYTHKANWITEKGEGEGEGQDACDHCRDVEYLDMLKPDCTGNDLHEDDVRNRAEVAENQMLSEVPDDKFSEMEGEDAVVVKKELGNVEDYSCLPPEGNSVFKSCDGDDVLIQMSQIDGSSFIDDALHSGRSPNNDRLAPVELIDCMTVEEQSASRCRVDAREVDSEEEQQIKESELPQEVLMIMTVDTDLEDGRDKDARQKKSAGMEASEISEILAQELKIDVLVEKQHEVGVIEVSQTIASDAGDIEAVVQNSEIQIETQEETKVLNFETEDGSSAERSFTPQVDETFSSMETMSQDESCCAELVTHAAEEVDQVRELNDGGESNIMSEPMIQFELIDRVETEEERVPEMPTSLDNIQMLHKKLLSERKESGSESLDGSVLSDIEGGEVLTIDRLKSALNAERKALHALYSELEEERSASAIAANQTMAMITRLQEEKAAVQMEALQYQRMMEEQTEYDQEALQLLNELMVKREKEKQELEKDLELYRKKVLHYEAKERMRKKVASGRTRTSSASSSADDSDEISLDLNEGEDNLLSFQETAQNTPTGEVPSSGLTQESERQHLGGLGESFAEFEVERLAILEQLKALEEKLFTLSDEEEEHYEDVKPIEHVEENGLLSTGSVEFSTPGENGSANGFCDDEMAINGVHSEERRLVGSKAKRLLPLFDTIAMENGEGAYEEHSVVSHSSSSKVASNDKRLAIEEEVDHVYERLQALEADREFLKHCINSVKKGDRGMDLLQEILQHLRDLRSVELRVRNTTDDHL